MKQWRSGSKNTLSARTIHAHEIPKLLKAMSDDDLHAYITGSGIKWYVAEYEVKTLSIREVWNLSVAQYDRIRQYIYENDPFVRWTDGDNGSN